MTDLNGFDFKIIQSKIKRANEEQLYFIMRECQEEMLRRKEPETDKNFEKYYIDAMEEIKDIGEKIENI